TVLPLAVTVLLAQSRGMSLLQIGSYMGAYALVIVLLELPTGALADLHGRRTALLVSMLLAAASQLLYGFAGSYAFFLIAALTSGAARAFSTGALQAWFVDALLQADPEAEIHPRLALAGTFQFAAIGSATLLGSLLPGLAMR